MNFKEHDRMNKLLTTGLFILTFSIFFTEQGLSKGISNKNSKYLFRELERWKMEWTREKLQEGKARSFFPPSTAAYKDFFVCAVMVHHY